jgi:hypothetical protein
VRRTARTWRGGAARNAATVFALGFVTLLFAACGSDSGPGVASRGSTTTTSPPSAATKASADGLRYSECMRAHGVSNYPDVTFSVIGGNLTLVNRPPPSIKSEPDFPSASMACRADLPLPPGAKSKHVNVQEELRFAQCMRSHGVTGFPDPLPGGGFRIPFDTNTPQFERAGNACEAKYAKVPVPMGSNGS